MIRRLCAACLAAAVVSLAAATARGVGPRAGRAARVELVAGDGLNEPFAIDFDRDGNTYVAEMGGNRVTVLDRRGGRRLLASDVKGPHHLLMGPDGALYVADTWNNRVRRFDLRTGASTVVAGTGEKGFSGDGGPAAEARFGAVFSIAFRGRLLYACDLDNRRIRAVDLRTGVVTTVAGNGEKGVPRDGEDARAQPLVDPRAIAVDRDGRLYICERGGHALRVVDPNGTIRTIAGTGTAGASGDGGPALSAQLNGPKHIFVEKNGDVLIADTENHVIRRYLPRTGRIERVAGTGGQGVGGLGGPPELCPLNRPHGAVVHPRTGELYIADSENHRILRVRSLRPLHGYGVLLRIRQISGEALEIPQGSLYPALYRLEHKGLLATAWGQSDNNRRAKYHTLTAAGRRRLREETAGWNRLATAMAAALDAVPDEV